MTEDRKKYRREYWATHPEYRAKEKARQLLTLPQKRKRQKEYNDKHPEKLCWYALVNRCTNPKNKKWDIYGGRGIKCLFSSYEEFFNELGKRPGKEYSIDRIDNNGNYEHGNVRWATLSQQNKNRRMPWATSNM